MNTDKRHSIEKKFETWEKQGLLRKKTFKVGNLKQPWLYIPVVLFFISLIIYFITYSTISTWSIGIFLIASIICNSIFKQAYLTKDGLLIKSYTSKHIIDYAEITSISGDKKGFVIRQGEKKYEVTSIDNPFQAIAFFKKFLVNKFTFTEEPEYQQACLRLFSQVVKFSNSEKSKAYAIDYLSRFVMTEKDKSIISEQIDNQNTGESHNLKYDCYSIIKDSVAEREDDLLFHLYECAYVSEGVDEAEENFLKGIAQYLNVSSHYIPPRMPEVEQDTIKLFAVIVGATNDEKSKKYAINYFRHNLNLYIKDSYINEQFARFCLNSVDEIKDSISRVGNELDHEGRGMLLDYLFECAYKSDGVDVNEVNILHEIATGLNIEESEFQAMITKYEQSQTQAKE